MSLLLTPARIASAFDLLRAFPPFSRWRLPEADHVEINLRQDKKNYATYTKYCRTDDHIIAMDAGMVWTMELLLMFLAHEMVHLQQERAKTFTRSMHNADFNRKAAMVCKAFGWNLNKFMGGNL